MEDALLRMAQFTEQQADLKGRTVGALAYPVFLGATGFLVVLILIVFFVPKFEDLFAGCASEGNCRRSPRACWRPAVQWAVMDGFR